MTVIYMILYGAYVDYFPTIFTRYGKKGSSILIAYVHEFKFKIQYGLQLVHVRNTNEDYLNHCLLLLLTFFYIIPGG